MSQATQLNKMGDADVQPSRWTAAHIYQLRQRPDTTIPLITEGDVHAIIPSCDLWDSWPVQLVSGENAVILGGTLWMILAAPRAADPNERHGVARIRLLHQRGDVWRDFGHFLPDDLCPGQREWSGSAVYAPETARITLYYTVAGRRGDVVVNFEQRLFAVTAAVNLSDDQIAAYDYTKPYEVVIADGQSYVLARASLSRPGFIKGFRDPAFFRDPADGRDYLVFTGSSAASKHVYDGVIGLAVAPPTPIAGQAWDILPPLIDAVGLSNELERPHLLVHEGKYYLFWSTQQQMFAPGGPSGPTGLYGMVADAVRGPYRPLNGSGLVAGNPPAEPHQGYSWWVSADLTVASFINHWGLVGRSAETDPVLNRAQFGGTPAPLFRLQLAGDCAKIVTV